MDMPPGQHMKPPFRSRLTVLVRRLTDRAALHEASARGGTPALSFRSAWAVLAAADIYGAIGRKVLSRGQNAWDRRVVVPGYEKLWHVVAALGQALWNRPRGPEEEITWSRHDFRPVAGW